MYMIHVTFEHQEHDSVEIHSPTTAVRHEHNNKQQQQILLKIGK